MFLEIRLSSLLSDESEDPVGFRVKIFQGQRDRGPRSKRDLDGPGEFRRSRVPHPETTRRDHVLLSDPRLFAFRTSRSSGST